MKQMYYRIPMELDQVMKKEDSNMVSLAKSVANTLRLITTSNFGECKYDANFGCAIWDHDFDTITNMQLFKETVKLSIEEAISRYERRLTHVVVNIGIQQKQSIIMKRRVKNMINISIRGKLLETNEDFQWEDRFFIGPLSYN